MNQNIKSFEDACNVLDIIPSIPDFSTIPDKYKGPALAHYKMMIIIEALNEGWVPDWNDFKQKKFILSFEMSSRFEPIFGEYDETCGNNWDDYPGSPVSSLMVFRSREIMEYAAENFRDIFREYFIPSTI